MIATTYDERMALIAELAQKYNKRTNMRKSVKASGARALKASKASSKREFADIPTETNIYQYTDSSQYAKQYYGETMYETTRFDNDWGDY